MLKKSITYRNLDGDLVTKEYYFHFSKAELLGLKFENGGIEKQLKEIAESKDEAQQLDAFKRIIGKSYGVRSEDGEDFIKSDEASEKFMKTEAFSELLMELMTNASKAAEFINGIMPKDLAEKVAAMGGMDNLLALAEKQSAENITVYATPRTIEAPKPVVPQTIVELPSYDIDSMSEEELIAMAEGNLPAKTIDDYTNVELLNMSIEEFEALAGKDPRKMPKRVLIIAAKRRSLGR